MKLRQLIVHAGMVTASLGLGVACSDDDDSLPHKGNYFPLTIGSHWTYELKRNCEWPNETEQCVDTNQARALNETLEWDESYKRIETPLLAQFAKVSGSEYFATGYYIPEYKFLDDELPAGARWGSEDAFAYDWFEIKEVNALKIVNGKIYVNVIVVGEEQSYSGDPIINNVYYFAKGIGLIYRKQTVTYRNQDTQRWEFSLKDYFIAR